MKKAKIPIGIVTALCAVSLAGCETNHIPKKENYSTKENSILSESTNESTDESTDEGTDSQEVYGHVVEFAEDGCTISPLETSADGNEAFAAAPGFEDPEKNINIHYQEGCIFQAVKINALTGAKKFSDAEISDIKKQTSLIIYGEWADTHSLKAEKVYIAHYEWE